LPIELLESQVCPELVLNGEVVEVDPVQLLLQGMCMPLDPLLMNGVRRLQLRRIEVRRFYPRRFKVFQFWLQIGALLRLTSSKIGPKTVGTASSATGSIGAAALVGDR
jgi:hypothetical protein